MVIAEQQQLLLRELRRVPALETKPFRVQRAGERGQRGRGSRSTHFTYPTDPLWSKQWSLVSIVYDTTAPHLM